MWFSKRAQRTKWTKLCILICSTSVVNIIEWKVVVAANGVTTRSAESVACHRLEVETGRWANELCIPAIFKKMVSLTKIT